MSGRGVYVVFEEPILEHVVDALMLESEPFHIVNDSTYVDGVMVKNVQDASVPKHLIYAKYKLGNNHCPLEVLIYTCISYNITYRSL